jgi:hypothetical protein
VCHQDRRRAAGEDTAVLDALLVKFEAAVDDAGVHLGNIAVCEEMQAVIERYGPGSWLTEELAAVAGVGPAAARRVLEDLVRESLAQRPEQPPLCSAPGRQMRATGRARTLPDEHLRLRPKYLSGRSRGPVGEAHRRFRLAGPGEAGWSAEAIKRVHFGRSTEMHPAPVAVSVVTCHVRARQTSNAHSTLQSPSPGYKRPRGRPGRAFRVIRFVTCQRTSRSMPETPGADPKGHSATGRR